MERISAKPPVRVQGTAVFLAESSEGTPPMLLYHLKHNQVAPRAGEGGYGYVGEAPSVMGVIAGTDRRTPLRDGEASAAGGVVHWLHV